MHSLKPSRTGQGKLVVAFLHMSVLVDSVSPRRLPINGQTMSWINHLDREQMGMVKRGRGCQEVYMVKRGMSHVPYSFDQIDHCMWTWGVSACTCILFSKCKCSIVRSGVHGPAHSDQAPLGPRLYFCVAWSFY